MKEVLLIAGLGPAHLSHNDQKDSYFFLDESQKKEYIISGYSFAPPDLLIEENGKLRPLLSERTEAELIVETLKTLFEQSKIDYSFLHIRELWQNKNRNKEHYKVICLSTSFMWSERMLQHAIKWIQRTFSYDALILGGQYAVLKRFYIMDEYPEVSFVSCGDADQSLLPLVRQLLSGEKKYSTIQSICYRNEGKIVETPFGLCDIDSDFLPNFKRSYNMIPYISMRGCPYRCGFCAQSNAFPTWQTRSAEKVIGDFKQYRDMGYCHIDIHDSTFFIPYEKAMKVAEGIRNFGVTWSANCRTDTPFTDDDIRLLEESGCLDLYVGFESMSDQVLGYMSKKTTTAHHRDFNNKFKESNINTTASFMVGYPGENYADHNLTREYLMKEHVGFFTITVFEFESKDMPVWKDRSKFQLEIYDDCFDDFIWQHGGLNWCHSGMNSDEAKSLRKKLIEDVRRDDNSLAVMRSWQYRYKFPYIVGRSKKETMRIEKLLDRLVYLKQDYCTSFERQEALKCIKNELSQYNIRGKIVVN